MKRIPSLTHLKNSVVEAFTSSPNHNHHNSHNTNSNNNSNHHSQQNDENISNHENDQTDDDDDDHSTDSVDCCSLERHDSGDHDVFITTTTTTTKKKSSTPRVSSLTIDVQSATLTKNFHHHNTTNTTNNTNNTNNHVKRQVINEDAFTQIISVQQLLLEEQLLLTQEKQNIVNSVNSINNSKIEIPNVLLHVRQANQKVKQFNQLFSMSEWSAMNGSMLVELDNRHDEALLLDSKAALPSCTTTTTSHMNNGSSSTSSGGGVGGLMMNRSPSITSNLNAEQAKQKLVNVWSKLQSNYATISGHQQQPSSSQASSQAAQDKQQAQISVNHSVALASFDDLPKRRLYRMGDKDHPLGASKMHFESLVEYLRYHPIVLAESCKSIIKFQQSVHDPAIQQKQPNLNMAKISKDSDHLVDIIVYSMYGNQSNHFECRSLLKLIKHSIQIAFENCTKVTDIMRNGFIRELLYLFMKRQGAEFSCSLINESLFELLQNDDFDIRLENVTTLSRSRTFSQPQPVSTISHRRTSTHDSSSSSRSKFSVDSDSFRSSKNIDPESIAKEEREKKLQSNMVNLYSICNKIISCLSTNIDSVPYTIRTVLNYIAEHAQNRFPNVKVEQRMKVVKAIFFQYFVIPGILDPQRVGAIDFMMLPALRNKLHTLAHVLSYLAVEKLFPSTSCFKGMNVFIEQNQAVTDNMLLKITERFDKSSILGFNFLQRISTSLNNFIRSPEQEKVTDELSPLCISTEDLKLLLHILIQSSFMKSSEVPQPIKDALVDVANYHVNTLHVLSKEKFMVMNMKELIPQEQLPDETKYAVNLKSDSIKYLIQQLLISVKHIESNMIGRRTSGVTIENILEMLYHHEKLANRMIAATTTRELLQRLKSSDKRASVYFSELHEDIKERQQYVNDIIECQKKLLVNYDLQQEYVQSLTDEKDKLYNMIQTAKFLPFFQNVVLFDFMHEFRKCAFVEDQEKKLRIQYFKLKEELMQFAQQNFIPQTELDNAYTRLKRLLLRRVYRLLLSPKGSPFEKKDDAIARKNKKMAPSITPAHLEIPKRYYSICNCKFVQEELLRLDAFVLPTDKLSTITKCSSILIELMRLSGDDAPSIDNFLPIFIFNIILSNPPRIFSNLKYISRFDELFENQSNQPIYYESRDYTGEYWLRHFEAAILFLESLDPDALLSQPIGKEESVTSSKHQPVVEFNTKLEVEKQFVRQQSRSLLTPTNTAQPKADVTQNPSPIHSPTHESLTDMASPEDLRRASVKLNSPPVFHSNSKPKVHFSNFKFMNLSVDELKYSEIPDLLAEYRYAVQQLQQLSSNLFPQQNLQSSSNDIDTEGFSRAVALFQEEETTNEAPILRADDQPLQKETENRSQPK